MLAKESGTVEYVDANRIRIRRDRDNGIDEYKLLKFKRSNQELASIRSHCNRGERVEAEKSLQTVPLRIWAKLHWVRTFL